MRDLPRLSHDQPDVPVRPRFAERQIFAMTTLIRHRSARAAAFALVLIGACTAPAPSEPEPEPPPTEPAPPPAIVVAPDPGESETFLALLDIAERALADDRLLTPEDDSAYRYYQQALAMAPDHPAPRRGFERIVERYLQLTHLAMEREQWAWARSLMARAATVDRSHPDIAIVRRQIELLANAERLILRLDRGALRERSRAIAQDLMAFGKRARSANARVSIRAPSDADGRWIYQQLSRAPGEERIRGAIEIGLPAQVTVMLLPEAS